MLDQDQMVIVIEDDKDDQYLIRKFAEDTHLKADFLFMNSGEDLDFYLFRDRLSQPFSFLRIPSIIILDLHLNGKNGFEILQSLKQHQFFKKIPVLVLSTSNNFNDINSCYALGCSGYFSKPVNEQEWKELMSAIKVYWFHCAAKPVLDSF